MRITISFILLLFTALFLSSTGNAQMAKIGCMDRSIRLQSEQMKIDMKAQGMEVYKDAMLTMTPKEPYPITVELTKGKLYQFVFVGSMDASKVYFELFDGKDKKIGEKTLDKPSENNFLVYSFIPSNTDIFLIVITQKIRGKKDICGSFTIMEKATGATQSSGQ